jgi:hypothetical protein
MSRTVIYQILLNQVIWLHSLQSLPVLELQLLLQGVLDALKVFASEVSLDTIENYLRVLHFILCDAPANVLYHRVEVSQSVEVPVLSIVLLPLNVV